MISTVPFDRQGDNSLKWGRYRDTDIIAAWVADMDFPSPPPVIEALQERLQCASLDGLRAAKQRLYDALLAYLASFHNWQVEQESITFLPGLVPALNWCSAMAGEPGDEILVPTPIYPPFLVAPEIKVAAAFACHTIAMATTGA